MNNVVFGRNDNHSRTGVRRSAPRMLIIVVTVIWFSAISISAQTPPPPRTWTSWIGPMPFTDVDIRPDYKYLWEQPDRWALIRQQTEVFKSYLGIFQAGRVTDAGLNALANLLKDNNKDVAFEVGGLRNYSGNSCNSQLGNDTWNLEYANFGLQRWPKNVKSLDYLTTDHAISSNYFYNCQLSIPELNSELLDYFELARAAFPGVQVGLIESLGQWRIGNYLPSDPSLPQVDLSYVLNDLKSQAQQRNIPIDHFDIDFGMEGVEYDCQHYFSCTNGLDYGRILATENLVHSLGWKVGVIANAYDINCYGAPPNICARDRTQVFLSNYFKTTANPDKMVFQQWQPYPDTLGDDGEDTDFTSSLGLIYASIFHLGTPAWLAVGDYKVLPGSTFIRVTGPSTYCQFNGPATPGTDGFGTKPRQMTNTGTCP